MISNDTSTTSTININSHSKSIMRLISTICHFIEIDWVQYGKWLYRSYSIHQLRSMFPQCYQTNNTNMNDFIKKFIILVIDLSFSSVKTKINEYSNKINDYYNDKVSFTKTSCLLKIEYQNLQ